MAHARGISRKASMNVNPRAYNPPHPPPPPPHKVFLEFFQEEPLPQTAVFSSCTHIPKTHFDTSLVKISYYGYEM